MNKSVISNELEGKLLTVSESKELLKEIENNYKKTGEDAINKNFDDIRQKLYNYENPHAEKQINGIQIKITDGLIRNKRKTYLLYANRKIIGEFFSPPNKIVKLIDSMDPNTFKNLSLKKEIKFSPKMKLKL